MKHDPTQQITRARVITQSATSSPEEKTNNALPVATESFYQNTSWLWTAVPQAFWEIQFFKTIFLNFFPLFLSSVMIASLNKCLLQIQTAVPISPASSDSRLPFWSLVSADSEAAAASSCILYKNTKLRYIYTSTRPNLTQPQKNTKPVH